MTIAQKLNEIKEDEVTKLYTEVKRLKQKRPPFNSHPEILKAYRLELEAAEQAHLLAIENAGNFHIKIGRDYQCPRCWVVCGVRSTVDPKAIGTRTRDYFGCDRCGLELQVPTGI